MSEFTHFTSRLQDVAALILVSEHQFGRHADAMLATREWYTSCPDGPMKRRFRADVITLAVSRASGELTDEAFYQRIRELNESAEVMAQRGAE